MEADKELAGREGVDLYILGWHSALCEHLALRSIRWLSADNTLLYTKTLPDRTEGREEQMKSLHCRLEKRFHSEVRRIEMKR